MDKKNIVIAGAGSGMGTHIAKVFARHGFRIFLIGRNEKKLQSYVETFLAEGIEAFGVPADISDTESMERAFNYIGKKAERIDVLVCNVTIRKPGFPTGLDNDELLFHYQTDVIGTLRCIVHVLHTQLKQRKGTILITGGGFSIYPMAEYTCVSLDKSVLRNLAYALYEEFKEQGIFVGIVTIMGNVVPGTHYDPDVIAEKYWQLYKERKQCELIYS